VSFRQWVAQFLRAKLAVALAATCWLVGGSAPALASDHLVLTGGYPQPIGKSADFSDAGGSIDVRWRHYNRGRTAYEFSVGYINNTLSGIIPSTVDQFETLVRQKNLLAQEQSGPGEGFILAEYGTLEIYSVCANIAYRLSRRARFSPLVSVGAGLYKWQVPFRIKFYDVPSFGEQRAFDPIASSRRYEFIFDSRFPEQVIDYTKREITGGLNVAVGADWRVMKNISFDLEGRAHLIFSSGKGDPEEGIDDQEYLSPMHFLLLHAGISYRF